MTVAPEPGPTLVMPLLRLLLSEQALSEEELLPRPIPRLLRLDVPVDAGLADWAVRTRAADEAALLVDEQGRVMAMSTGCGTLLGLDPLASVGALLLDLVVLVDFSATGVPLVEPELQTPPLRSLKSGTMARGLVRLQRADGHRTYDVVGIPLAGRVGALAFLTEV
ncbi:MAG: fold-4 domain protein [Frankiales bacterium]|nr:fold-4 domain protein [Frankiales bacterium]